MPLTTIWEHPERIDDFCHILVEIYEMRKTAKSQSTKEALERYLLKYTDELIELVLAVVEGRLYSNNIGLSSATQQNFEIPGSTSGWACRNIIKLFKASIALRYTNKEFKAKTLLVESLNHYLELVNILIEGSEIDLNAISNKLHNIEKEFEHLLKSE
jgi:L-serine deaminase